MQKAQLQPAYVLHSRPFRESSQLLELLTRDFGRVGAVARGARGAKSRWRGVLQPFRPLLVSFSRRSELATLTAVDQVAAPPALAGEALYCGLYLNELTLRLLLRDDPHDEVFEQYRQALGALVDGETLQTALRLYEKQLLDATGFGLILDREAGSDRPLDPEARYDYQPDRGPVRVSASARERAGFVTGQVLQALDAGYIDPADWPALRHLMRRVLKRQLGERPLASEALFRALRRGSAGFGEQDRRSEPQSNREPATGPAGNEESHNG